MPNEHVVDDVAAGVSDVWASSLWALDILFGMASVGVQRWNFHGMPGGPYAVFNFPNPSTEEVEVRPIFYGLLAFSAAAGGASVITNVTTVASTNPFIKCWCVVDSGNRARVVLIHKDMNATANATVTVVPAAPAARGHPPQHPLPVTNKPRASPPSLIRAPDTALPWRLK